MIYKFEIREKLWKIIILIALLGKLFYLFLNLDKSRNGNVLENILDVVLKIFHRSIFVLDSKLYYHLT